LFIDIEEILSKKIVLFTTEFPFGQQETFLENELSYLAGAFDRVIIVPLFNHPLKRKIAYSNISVYTPVNNSREISIHKLVLIFSITFWKTLLVGGVESRFNPKHFFKVLKQAFIVSRLKKYLKKRTELFENDLWYFYWGTNSVNIVSFLKKIPKVVARYHRYDLYGQDIPGGEFQLFQERTLNCINKAIFISKHGKEYVRSKYNQFSHKLELSRLGVPYRGKSQASSDKILRILTCSNFYAVKRIHLLSEALKKIENINIEWSHIGGGTQKIKNQVVKIVEEFPENITFNDVGRISNAQAMEYYCNNKVDLFINVSVSEGLPVSIMEAMSFGVPVIATDVGGTKELLSQGGGKLLDLDFEVSELVQMIRNFYIRNHRNEDYRNEAFQAWQQSVDADTNYIDFIAKLYKLIEDEEEKVKLTLISDDASSQKYQ
jgi:glycosyltransferase involved in cell wall biosynthesis